MPADHPLCCDCLDCLGPGESLPPPRAAQSVTPAGRELEQKKLAEQRARDRSRYVPTGRPMGRPRKQVSRG